VRTPLLDRTGRYSSRYYRHCTNFSEALKANYFLERRLWAKFAEFSSLLKNPSTPLPSTLQVLKNPAIGVFWR
jgi:hypothetical protein